MIAWRSVVFTVPPAPPAFDAADAIEERAGSWK
jgi:hypothetical protein